MAAIQFDYSQVSGRVVQELRRVLGENTTIATEEGYLGRIHLKIVSPIFNGKAEKRKAEFSVGHHSCRAG